MNTSQITRKAYKKIISGAALVRRNACCVSGDKTCHNQVNLEWVDNNNLGDELAPVIYNWMLEKRQIQPNQYARKTIHLMTVGSMVGTWNFDATIWGSGIHTFSNVSKLSRLRHIQKFDIRAVRGPVTRSALMSCGHICPEIYGDPAVLMPFIYVPDNLEKKYPLSVVLHYRAGDEWKTLGSFEGCELRYLNIGTNNYKQYIDEMVLSEKIISSSLHGIILAETYGIPAIFLDTGGYVNEALMKYYDWYYSTGRYSVKVARSLEEAIKMEPMQLPELDRMRENLLEAFPYDLWKNIQ
ncbi:MAG: polysaccharide pyruvyl transferase family protein [Lachnospiraceae bacterium]|nr:polysaccharide pyruvyl transferase family protein [Lachnospiraceae bacterium]